MSALAADHRNDVVATIVALVFGIIGKILERKNSRLLIFIYSFCGKRLPLKIHQYYSSS
jgi:hypothetical protein